MKIAIIGSDSFDSLEFHLKDELIQTGHNTAIFGYPSTLPKKVVYGMTLFSMSFIERQNQKLLDRLLAFSPDLVIGVYRHIHPLVVKGVKASGIRIIHLNPDALTTFQNQQLFVEPYDAYFSKDPYIVDFMRQKLNLNARLYSEAFNERVHKRPDTDAILLEKETNIDVLCFGNLYPYRNRMLHLLKEKGVNIEVYGHKAKYFDPFLLDNFRNKGIYGEEKARILNGAKIVFNNFHYAEIGSVNNKFFEVSGCGAFQLCDYKPILKDLLPIDPELVSFKSIDKAHELIAYYLDKPEKRFEIRDVIMKHFLEHYTYKQLVKTILS